MVDRSSFWLSCRNLFQGAKSIVMQTSIVFGPKFEEEGESLHLSKALLRNITDVKWQSWLNHDIYCRRSYSNI